MVLGLVPLLLLAAAAAGHISISKLAIIDLKFECRSYSYLSVPAFAYVILTECAVVLVCWCAGGAGTVPLLLLLLLVVRFPYQNWQSSISVLNVDYTLG